MEENDENFKILSKIGNYFGKNNLPEIAKQNKFVELGYLPFTPSTNIITTNGTYEALYRVDAGTNKLLINTLENTLKSFECYFFYVS